MVAGAEICVCHGGKNSFLATWKLIFNTLEIDFYHHRKYNYGKRLVSFELNAITTLNNKPPYNSTYCWIPDLKNQEW